jgi:hypothetical protein
MVEQAVTKKTYVDALADAGVDSRIAQSQVRQETLQALGVLLAGSRPAGRRGARGHWRHGAHRTRGRRVAGRGVCQRRPRRAGSNTPGRVRRAPAPDRTGSSLNWPNHSPPPEKDRSAAAETGNVTAGSTLDPRNRGPTRSAAGDPGLAALGATATKPAPCSTAWNAPSRAKLLPDPTAAGDFLRPPWWRCWGDQRGAAHRHCGHRDRPPPPGAGPDRGRLPSPGEPVAGGPLPRAFPLGRLT